MPSITLPNHQPLAFDDVGHGGVPLVLLHGYPLDRQMWAPQLAGLRGHRVIAPDLRGFGESAAAVAPRTLTEHADDIAALLDTLGMAQAVPGATLVEIAGAGHLPPLEQPAVVTAALQQFLDALAPPG